MPSVSIIIPVYNEDRQLASLMDAIGRLDLDVEVILVDDGSDTRVQPFSSPVEHRIVQHPYNMGNGAAVKSGIRAARGDILVCMDGDGQHDPRDIASLLEHLGPYDMVVGARAGNQHASGSRRFMNRIFNGLASYVTGFRVKDLTSGFRAMRADTAKGLLPFLPNGYSWPTTSTLVLIRSGFSVRYVPVNVQPRRSGRSRIRPVRDAVRFLMIIMKICTLYAPFRIFLPVSLGMFLLGLGNYAYTFFTSGRFTNMSALMFTAAVIIFMMGLISEQVSQISLLRHQRVKSTKEIDSQ